MKFSHITSLSKISSCTPLLWGLSSLLGGCSLQSKPLAEGATRIPLEFSSSSESPALWLQKTLGFQQEETSTDYDPTQISFDKLTCFFVNVVGTGIPSKQSGDSAAEIASRIAAVESSRSSCSYPGIVSSLLPKSSSERYIDIFIPTGKVRTIQLLGVTSKDSVCDTGSDFWTILKAYDQVRANKETLRYAKAVVLGQTSVLMDRVTREISINGNGQDGQNALLSSCGKTGMDPVNNYWGFSQDSIFDQMIIDRLATEEAAAAALAVGENSSNSSNPSPSASPSSSPSPSPSPSSSPYPLIYSSAYVSSQIEVYGIYFSNISSLTIGGTSCYSFSVLDSGSKITCAGSSPVLGSYNVSVSNSNGSYSLDGALNIYANSINFITGGVDNSGNGVSSLNEPEDIYFYNNGADNLAIIADTGNHCVRLATLTGSTPVLRSEIGQCGPSRFGNYPSTNTNTPALATGAQFNRPNALARLLTHYLFVADAGNKQIKVINLGATGGPEVVEVIGKSGGSYFGEDGVSVGAVLSLRNWKIAGEITDIAAYGVDTLYVSEIRASGRGYVHKIQFSGSGIFDFANSTVVSTFRNESVSDTQLGAEGIGYVKSPIKLAADNATGAIFIADASSGQMIRMYASDHSLSNFFTDTSDVPLISGMSIYSGSLFFSVGRRHVVKYVYTANATPIYTLFGVSDDGGITEGSYSGAKTFSPAGIHCGYLINGAYCWVAEKDLNRIRVVDNFGASSSSIIGDSVTYSPRAQPGNSMTGKLGLATDIAYFQDWMYFALPHEKAVGKVDLRNTGPDIAIAFNSNTSSFPAGYAPEQIEILEGSGYMMVASLGVSQVQLLATDIVGAATYGLAALPKDCVPNDMVAAFRSGTLWDLFVAIPVCGGYTNGRILKFTVDPMNSGVNYVADVTPSGFGVPGALTIHPYAGVAQVIATDLINNNVIRFPVSDNVPTTKLIIAGSSSGNSGNNDSANPLSATFRKLSSVTSDGINLYFGDTGNSRLRQMRYANTVGSFLNGSVTHLFGDPTESQMYETSVTSIGSTGSSGARSMRYVKDKGLYFLTRRGTAILLLK